MATPIEVPKLGNTVEECLIVRWLKHPGDLVAEGDLIVEIETDKASFELIAPAGGTLLGAFFEEGELAPVYSNVCVVGEPGENIDKFRPEKTAAIPNHGLSRKDIPVSRFSSVAAIAAPALDPQPDLTASFSPRGRCFAQERNFYPANATGSGPGGRILEEDLKRLYYATPKHSALAQKLVENGCELRGTGSGAKGMVLSGDLTSPPIRMTSIREKIARRMMESLETTAQYTLNASAAATSLLSLRNRIKTSSRREALPDININEMVLFCTVKALAAAPEMNVEFFGGKIYQNSNINVGFACDTPKGLLVPVVHESQRLSLPDLAVKIKAHTKQAAEGSIAPDDLSGATFTVSNLGIYGIESFSPILTPPQVAILGVNAIELKPVRRNNTVEFIDCIGLSLTCDHQVIDGAQGARFLRIVREQIENIETIAELTIDD